MWCQPRVAHHGQPDALPPDAVAFDLERQRERLRDLSVLVHLKGEVREVRQARQKPLHRPVVHGAQIAFQLELRGSVAHWIDHGLTSTTLLSLSQPIVCAHTLGGPCSTYTWLRWSRILEKLPQGTRLYPEKVTRHWCAME